MKKVFIALFLGLIVYQSNAQSAEAQQLLLNWEKLTQLKQILQHMYDGYKIVYKGYSTIKDISKGNFDLHKGFLDRMLEVSPTVKKYKKIVDVINYQVRIISESKSALRTFQSNKVFTRDEVNYLAGIYANLFNESVKNLDNLMLVVTSGQLRMSDSERLEEIDRVFASIEEQYSFLQEFNNQTAVLAIQREKELMDLQAVRSIYGMK